MNFFMTYILLHKSTEVASEEENTQKQYYWAHMYEGQIAPLITFIF